MFYRGAVTGTFLLFSGLVAASLVLDGLVRPRRGGDARWPLRSAAGMVLHMLLVASDFGLFLGICGNPLASAILTLALVALFTVVSNAKHTMLGEPLVFTDLVLVGAVLRHPQFYLSALSPVQKGALIASGPVLLALFAWLFVGDIGAHLAGAVLLAGSLVLLRWVMAIPPWRDLASAPDLDGDVCRHGLLATLLLYWLRWRATANPAPRAHPEVAIGRTAAEPPLAVIVQCESFADPVELFGDPALELPGLARARSVAWQWGDLNVSGFGAYTMRTEYGLIFGRDEEELGFRRFDPFLTAVGEASHALPARLAGRGWRSLFLHPHDLRFYNRQRIMPAAGFAEMVGEEHFAPPSAGEGRYVTDAAMAGTIGDLARKATEATVLYAVTIENHGPWAPEDGSGPRDLVSSYLRLVRNSDAMLATLLEALADLGRPSVLVFFGDHRPSIPGVTTPGPVRHTPYVVVRLDAFGAVVKGERRRVDLTPAQLHHAVHDLLATLPAA
ncbi:LTA synthase family protein [Novosphingobium sp. LASN5T]|nr:LTA synthase family protein [Novosphingobium sp. LASN5T]RQW43189.1 LTA synthase family protein [Novosphingobium sp. LASN5T]